MFSNRFQVRERKKAKNQQKRWKNFQPRLEVFCGCCCCALFLLSLLAATPPLWLCWLVRLIDGWITNFCLLISLESLLYIFSYRSNVREILSLQRSYNVHCYRTTRRHFANNFICVCARCHRYSTIQFISRIENRIVSSPHQFTAARTRFAFARVVKREHTNKRKQILPMLQCEYE